MTRGTYAVGYDDRGGTVGGVNFTWRALAEKGSGVSISTHGEFTSSAGLG